MGVHIYAATPGSGPCDPYLRCNCTRCLFLTDTWKQPWEIDNSTYWAAVEISTEDRFYDEDGCSYFKVSRLGISRTA